MAYRRLIIGDANIVKFWQASQTARKELVGVPLMSVVCQDTLEVALQEVHGDLDFVLVSALTSLLIEEGSADDVRGSCINVLETALKKVDSVAKRLRHVEVF